VAGGVIGYFALSGLQPYLPYALGVSAACLLYVAVADLIPGLHRRVDPASSALQVLLIGLGVAAVGAVEFLAPH
jgi:zinc and cadmium transporter